MYSFLREIDQHHYRMLGLLTYRFDALVLRGSIHPNPQKSSVWHVTKKLSSPKLGVKDVALLEQIAAEPWKPHPTGGCNSIKASCLHCVRTLCTCWKYHQSHYLFGCGILYPGEGPLMVSARKITL